MSGLEGRRQDFEAAGACVLAINPAEPEDHKKFATILGLGYPILSDPGGDTAKLYRAKYPLVAIPRRTVYAVGPDWKIIFAERGHADLKLVLEAIKNVT